MSTCFHTLCVHTQSHELDGEMSTAQGSLLLGYLAVIGFAHQRHSGEPGKMVGELFLYEGIIWWKGFSWGDNLQQLGNPWPCHPHTGAWQLGRNKENWQDSSAGRSASGS